MPITDLTGCVWVANNNISASNSYTTYSINFSNNNISGSNVKIPLANYSYGKVFSSGVNSNTFNDLCLNSSNQWIIYNNDDEYVVETIGTLEITITGGTDVTNATLIAWLEENGTLTAPIQANTYTLTHNLTNVSKGNTKFTITPDAGYELPSSVSVSNGTLVSYDSTTGEVVVSGDNAVISAECVASAPSGYSVTFSTITVSVKDASSGGFYVLVNDSDFTTGGFHYDYVLEAEDYGTGVWYDSNGNIISIPFVVNDVSFLSFMTKGNGFTISLNGTQKLSVSISDFTVYTLNITEDCTLTGTAERTD